MKFEVLILGNSSATPMYDRHPTSQLLNFNEQFFLIDCGEGTQTQLFRYGVKSNKISYIFISHLHGDHYLGLVGLLSSMNLHGRKNDLYLYGPAALMDILHLQFLHSDTTLRYNLVFRATDPDNTEVILETPMLKVISFPLQHRVPTTGFRFDEGPRLAPLIREKVEQLNIPTVFLPLLKRGVDCTDADGTVYRSKDLTRPAPIPRSYAYCSDTRSFAAYMDHIHNVDLLYHEATFTHDMLARAEETLHATAYEAAQVAGQVNAKRLLLGHYSARYKDLSALLDEALQIFPRTELSIEGKWFIV